MPFSVFFTRAFISLFILCLLVSLSLLFEPAEVIHDLVHHNSLERFEADDLMVSFFIFLTLYLSYFYATVLKKDKTLSHAIGESAESAAIIKNVPIGIAQVSSDFCVIALNKSFSRLTQKIPSHEIRNIIDQLVVKSNDFSLGLDKVSCTECYAYLKKDICLRWFLFKSPLESDHFSYLLAVEEVQSYQNISEEFSLANEIIDNSPMGIMVADESMNITYVNKTFEKITGYMSQDVLGLKPSILNSSIHDQSFYEIMFTDLKRKGCWQGEIWNKKKSGDTYLEWLSITIVNDSRMDKKFYIGTFSEITAQEHVRNKLHHLAYYDSLTSLPNRSLFLERLEEMTEQDSEKSLCVIFLDLDNFKRINDSLGHSIGDQLLAQFSSRLSSNIRNSDLLARWGGMSLFWQYG